MPVLRRFERAIQEPVGAIFLKVARNSVATGHKLKVQINAGYYETI